MFPLKASLIMFAFCCATVFGAQSVPPCGVCSTNEVAALDVPSFPTLRSASSPQPALGEKKLLYIRVNFPDDLTEPISRADAETLMTTVSTFFRKHSYGQCTVSASVTPLLTLPSPKSAYFVTNSATGQIEWYPHTLLQHARTLAREAGFDTTSFDVEMVRMNTPILQSWGNIGVSGAWMMSSHPATTIHEVGHNLGLHHSNAWQGPMNGPGTNKEYGDPFDVMGNSFDFAAAGFNTIGKTALGWLDDSHVLHVTESGIYRLYAHDTERTLPGRKYLLRLRKDDERDYWVEKRQYMDFTDNFETSGTLVYWDAWSESNSGTHLLNPVQSTDYVLPVHRGLVDDVAALRIIPLRQSMDRSYMDVAVIFGSSSMNMLPNLITFTGTPGLSYTLQTSPNLVGWTDQQELTSETGEFLVPVSLDASYRFFRIIETPVH